jgi:DNA-directed RNA polymerase alpha subunit
MHDSLDRTPIEALHLSLQAIGSLKRTQIHTIADLMNYTQEDLEILDKPSAQEVIAALQEKMGLSLPLNDLQ